jgi:hypothetical protein
VEGHKRNRSKRTIRAIRYRVGIGEKRFGNGALDCWAVAVKVRGSKSRREAS